MKSSESPPLGHTGVGCTTISLPLLRTVGFARNRALRGGGQSAEQTKMAVEGYRTPEQAMVDLVPRVHDATRKVRTGLRTSGVSCRCVCVPNE